MSAAWLVLAAFVPRCAHAQKQPAASACVFDTAAYRDTIVVNLAIVARRDADTASDPALTEAIAAMMRARLRVSPSIGTLFYPNVTGPGLAKVGPGGWIYGLLAATIRPGGNLVGVHWLASTGDSATDASLFAAISDPPDSASNADFLAFAQNADASVTIVLTSSGAPRAVPILRVRVPFVHVDSGVDTRTLVTPKYPAGARWDGVQGKVELQYMVDESGHAARKSIQVLSAPSREFAKSAVDAIMGMTFRPAMAGGCPLKMNVSQRVRYTIGPPPPGTIPRP